MLLPNDNLLDIQHDSSINLVVVKTKIVTIHFKQQIYFMNIHKWRQTTSQMVRGWGWYFCDASYKSKSHFSLREGKVFTGGGGQFLVKFVWIYVCHPLPLFIESLPYKKYMIIDMQSISI